ncbi:MAG: MBL fold metallo-hydrolase [Desulfobacterales bacterium]|nr:MAG: MBL fold metallo-hydrolase [Desulfobacterales bacterium]
MMDLEKREFGPLSIIPGMNRGRYPYCHSVYVEDAGVVIDPASDRERLAEIKAHRKIQIVWLSHWHEDHFMHLDIFDGLPLWMSEQDSPPLADTEVFLDWYDIIDKDERVYWSAELREKFHFRPRKPARFLRDGERIDLGDLSVEVIHTPGHTPGHLAFFFREPQILFLGDYDLTPFGPWYGDRYSSIEQTIDSIHLLKKIPAKVWLTGHETGAFEENPQQFFDDYLTVIQSREDKLLDFLKQPRSMQEIIGAWIVYGRKREPVAFYAFGERLHMQKHLEKLMANGAVKFENGKYCRIS